MNIHSNLTSDLVIQQRVISVHVLLYSQVLLPSSRVVDVLQLSHGICCFVHRALGRIANAYAKKDNLKEALHFYNKSLAEHRDADMVKKAHQVCE